MTCTIVLNPKQMLARRPGAVCGDAYRVRCSADGGAAGELSAARRGVESGNRGDECRNGGEREDDGSEDLHGSLGTWSWTCELRSLKPKRHRFLYPWYSLSKSSRLRCLRPSSRHLTAVCLVPHGILVRHYRQYENLGSGRSSALSPTNPSREDDRRPCLSPSDTLLVAPC
ncbi:hypothetical protein EXIGLDRAFT_58937 [Exidia glandulosa HHB12029]|uniref:Uncharacterized protein n=1 Tax=Exidia glandulosa HHB12029 TaxID=1314781 RepID=A0A166AKT4_EXIGL|nr:hypothetical protein EXIGLDRAFT_58937 [Exidia glandulosa HHB12029]